MGITGEWVLPPQPVARTGTNLTNLGGEFLLQGPAKRHSEGGTSMRGRIIDPGTGREVYLGGNPVYIERELRDGSGTYRDYGGGSLLAQAMQRGRQGSGSSYRPEQRIDPAALVLDEGDLGPEDLRSYDWQDKVRESVAQEMMTGGRAGADAWITAQKVKDSQNLPTAWDSSGGDPADLSISRKRGDFVPEYGQITLPVRTPNGEWTSISVDPGAIAEVVTKNPDAYYTSERDEQVPLGKKAQLLSNKFKTPVITERALRSRMDEGVFRGLTSEEASNPAFKDAIGILNRTYFEEQPLGGSSRAGNTSPYAKRRLVSEEVPVYEMSRREDQEPLYRIGSPYARQYDKLNPAMIEAFNQVYPAGSIGNTRISPLSDEENVIKLQQRAQMGLDKDKGVISFIPGEAVKLAAAQGKTIAGPHSFIRGDGGIEVRVPSALEVINKGVREMRPSATNEYIRTDQDFYNMLRQQPYERAFGIGPILPSGQLRAQQEKEMLGGVQGMSVSQLIKEMGPLGGPPIDSDPRVRPLRAAAEFGLIPPEARIARREQLLRRGNPEGTSAPIPTPAPDYELPTAVDMPGTDYDALDVDYDTDSTAFGTGYKTFDRPGNPLSNRLQPFVQVAEQLGVPDPVGVAEVAIRTAPVSNGQVLFDDVVQRIAEIAAPPVRSIGEDTVARNNRAVLRSAYKLPASAMPPLAEIVPDPEARRALVTLGLDRALESGDPAITDAAERLLVARQVARARNQATPPVTLQSRLVGGSPARMVVEEGFEPPLAVSLDPVRTSTSLSPAYSPGVPTGIEPYFTGGGVMASKPVAPVRIPRSALESARAAYAAALAGPERQRQEWIPGLASSPAELEARPRIGDRDAYEAQAAYQRQLDYWKRAGAKARSEQSLGGRYFYPNEQPLQLSLPGWSASPIDRQEPGRLRQLLQEMASRRIS